jgi:hypothetical protein
MRTGYTTFDVTEMGMGAREIWRSVLDQSVHEGAGEIEIGTVIQVFDRSVYVELDHEGLADRPVPPIVLLGTNDLRSGQLLTRIDAGPGFSFDEVGIDSGGQCRLGRSTVSNRFTITLDRVVEARFAAELLRPSPEGFSQIHDHRSIARRSDAWNRTRETLDWVVESEIEDGLDWFSELDKAVDHTNESLPSGKFETLGATWADLFDSRSAERFDVGPWEGIIGKGPGATPSGDDAISGVLLTLTHLTDGDMRTAVQEAGMEIVATAEGSTPTVSAALMEQAALGRGPSVAMRCLRRLLTPSGLDSRRDSVSDLIEVGHTSGADILSGMFLAILVIAPMIGNSG